MVFMPELYPTSVPPMYRVSHPTGVRLGAVKAELDNKLFFGLILCNPLKHFCVCKGFNGCHMQRFTMTG